MKELLIAMAITAATSTPAMPDGQNCTTMPLAPDTAIHTYVFEHEGDSKDGLYKVVREHEIESLKRRVEDLEIDVKELIQISHDLMLSVLELKVKERMEKAPVTNGVIDLLYRQSAPVLDLDPVQGEWM